MAKKTEENVKLPTVAQRLVQFGLKRGLLRLPGDPAPIIPFPYADGDVAAGFSQRPVGITTPDGGTAQTEKTEAMREYVQRMKRERGALLLA